MVDENAVGVEKRTQFFFRLPENVMFLFRSNLKTKYLLMFMLWLIENIRFVFNYLLLLVQCMSGWHLVFVLEDVNLHLFMQIYSILVPLKQLAFSFTNLKVKKKTFWWYLKRQLFFFVDCNVTFSHFWQICHSLLWSVKKKLCFHSVLVNTRTERFWSNQLY